MVYMVQTLGQWAGSAPVGKENHSIDVKDTNLQHTKWEPALGYILAFAKC